MDDDESAKRAEVDAEVERQRKRFLIARITGEGWDTVVKIPDDVLDLLLEYAKLCGKLPIPFRSSIWTVLRVEARFAWRRLTERWRRR